MPTKQVIVKAGDTLSRIARDSGTTVEAILKENPQIRDPSGIRIGSKINVPVKANESPSTIPRSSQQQIAALQAQLKDIQEKLKSISNSVQSHFAPVPPSSVAQPCTSCVPLTGDLINRAFGGVLTKSQQDSIASEISEARKRGFLNSPTQLINFLAQCRKESIAWGAYAPEENLNYSVKVLKDLKFGERKVFSIEDAEKYGSIGAQPPPEASATLQKRWKDGDTKAHKDEIGDIRYKTNGEATKDGGANFRGRGMIHVTWDYGYTGFTAWHKQTYGEDVDFYKSPEIVSKPPYDVRSAIWVWYHAGAFASIHPSDMVEKEITKESSDKISKAINGAFIDAGNQKERFGYATEINSIPEFHNLCDS